VRTIESGTGRVIEPAPFSVAAGHSSYAGGLPAGRWQKMLDIGISLRYNDALSVHNGHNTTTGGSSGQRGSGRNQVRRDGISSYRVLANDANAAR